MSDEELMDEWRKTKAFPCDGPNSPQPSLTAEEREAVERAAFVAKNAGLERSAATLRNLLERTK